MKSFIVLYIHAAPCHVVVVLWWWWCVFGPPVPPPLAHHGPTQNQPPPPSSEKFKKKKNLFNPITIYLNLTKNNKKNLKIKPPHHSSVYIFAHVESGWFVIYFSKLPAALSCGSPINFLPSATLSLMCWPLTPTACAFWISPINSQTVELLI